MGCVASKDAAKPAAQVAAVEVPKPSPPPIEEQHVHAASTAKEPVPEPERPVAVAMPSTVPHSTAFMGEANGQKAAKNISITEVHPRRAISGGQAVCVPKGLLDGNTQSASPNTDSYVQLLPHDGSVFEQMLL